MQDRTSSMKTMDGARSRARLNSCATSFSLSPIHLLTKSDDDTLKKVDSASVATACDGESSCQTRGSHLLTGFVVRSLDKYLCKV